MAGIFKAYDIRGIVGEQLDVDMAERIGRAVVEVLGARRLVVGRDMRASSGPLSEALMAGMTSAGCDVVAIGISSTPMVYYAVATLGTDGGVQVTASHNPKEYNGFKICGPQALPVSYEGGIDRIEELVTRGAPPEQGRGRIETRNVLDGFVEHVLSFAGLPWPRRLKVVVDAGNGMAGYTMKPILEALPVEAAELYFELDGTFPNHPANPLEPENVVDCEERVRAEGADLGLAFDGDADRVFFVDDRGEVVSADRITVLLARRVLERGPATIVYDLRSSRLVAEEVEALGGRALRSRVGHAFIKEMMRREDAAFAGELSGHFYFRDNWYADSGEIAAVTLMGLLAKEGRKLSEILASLDRYVSSGEINFRVEDGDALMKALAASYPEGRIDWLDGLTVQFPDWWFNIRKSNTEPLIRLNIEAESAAALDERLAEVRRRIVELGGVPH